MSLVEALNMVVGYLEQREKQYGERHPSLASLKVYALDEAEIAGLESKSKEELIRMIKGRKTIDNANASNPGIIRVTPIKDVK